MELLHAWHTAQLQSNSDLWSCAWKRKHVQCICIYQCKDRVSSMKNQETDSRVPLSWLRESTMVWKPCPPIPISYTSTLWCLVLPCMIVLPKLKVPKGSLLFQFGTATEIQCEAQWAYIQVPVPPFPCLLGFQITEGLWKQYSLQSDQIGMGWRWETCDSKHGEWWGQWPWQKNRCSYRHHDLSKLFANMSSISKQCWQKPSALAWKEVGTSASSILL